MKFLIYVEVLILAQIYLMYRAFKKHLTFVGNTAEFYSEHGIHFWQPQKALQVYADLTEKTTKERANDIDALKKEVDKLYEEDKRNRK